MPGTSADAKTLCVHALRVQSHSSTSCILSGWKGLALPTGAASASFRDQLLLADATQHNDT